MVDIGKHWFSILCTLLVIIGYFVEISRIKINPLSFIITRLSNAFNKPALDQQIIIRKELDYFNKKLDALTEKVEKTDKKIDINEAKRIRAEIMAFATSCKKREEHNEDQFKTIIDLHQDYIELIEKVELTNGVLDEDYNFIMHVYRNCRDSGKFYANKCYVKKDNKEE